MVMGTRSGNMSSGKRDGGNTGGTFVGKVSDTAVTIKLDLPVPRSPAMTIRMPFLFPGDDSFAIQFKFTENKQKNKPIQRTSDFDSQL